MVSDTEAEHLPGCNLALRKSTLEAVGGFDPQFRAAGDDVDLCWRVQDAGGRLEFAPGALVWHHRRDRVRSYWRQQRGYGKAEALLEAKARPVLLASIHCIAAMPGDTLVERFYCDFARNPLGDAINPVNGRIPVPQGPGLGMELDEEKLRRYQLDA